MAPPEQPTPLAPALSYPSPVPKLFIASLTSTLPGPSSPTPDPFFSPRSELSKFSQILDSIDPPRFPGSINLSLKQDTSPPFGPSSDLYKTSPNQDRLTSTFSNAQPPHLVSSNHETRTYTADLRGQDTAQSEEDSFYTAPSPRSAAMSGGMDFKYHHEARDSPPPIFDRRQDTRPYAAKRPARPVSPALCDHASKRNRPEHFSEQERGYSVRRRIARQQPENVEIVSLSSDGEQGRQPRALPHDAGRSLGMTRYASTNHAAHGAQRQWRPSRSLHGSELAQRDASAPDAKEDLMNRFLLDAHRRVNPHGDMPPLSSDNRSETQHSFQGRLLAHAPAPSKQIAHKGLGPSIFTAGRQSHTKPTSALMQQNEFGQTRQNHMKHDGFKVPPRPPPRGDRRVSNMPFHQDSDTEDSQDDLANTKFYGGPVQGGASDLFASGPFEGVPGTRLGSSAQTVAQAAQSSLSGDRPAHLGLALSTDPPGIDTNRRGGSRTAPNTDETRTRTGGGRDTSRNVYSAERSPAPSASKSSVHLATVESEADRAMRSHRRMDALTAQRMLELAAATQAENCRKTRLQQDDQPAVPDMDHDMDVKVKLKQQVTAPRYTNPPPYEHRHGAPTAPMTMMPAVAQMTSGPSVPPPCRVVYDGLNLHDNMPEKVEDYTASAGISLSSSSPKSIQQIQERNARMAQELSKRQRDILSDAGSARDDNWTSHVADYDRNKSREAQHQRINQQKHDRERKRIEASLINPLRQRFQEDDMRSRESTPHSSFSRSGTRGARSGGQQSRKMPAGRRNGAGMQDTDVPFSADEVAAYQIEDVDKQIMKYKERKGFEEKEIAMLVRLSQQDVESRVKMLEAKRAAERRSRTLQGSVTSARGPAATGPSHILVEQVAPPIWQPSDPFGTSYTTFEQPYEASQQPETIPQPSSTFFPQSLEPLTSLPDALQPQSPMPKDRVARLAQISPLAKPPVGRAFEEIKEERERRGSEKSQRSNQALVEKNKQDQERKRMELELGRAREEQAEAERIEAEEARAARQAREEATEKERRRHELQERNAGLLKNAGKGRASKMVARSTHTGFVFPDTHDNEGIQEDQGSAVTSRAKPRAKTADPNGSDNAESEHDAPKAPPKTPTKRSQAKAFNNKAATKASEAVARNQRGFATKAGKQMVDLKSFKDLIKLANTLDDTGCDAESHAGSDGGLVSEDILGEDTTYNIYYVKRKVWTEEDEPDDDDAGLILECGQYTSRTAANRAVVTDCLCSTGADADIVLDPREEYEIHSRPLKHGLSCLYVITPNGNIKVWAERVTRSKYQGELPAFERASFISRDLWCVQADTHTLAADEETWVKTEEFVGKACTTPAIANGIAAKTLIDRTFSSTATRIDEINVQKTAANYELEDELDRLMANDELFDQERENSKGQKIRLWVWQWGLEGPRN